jgi:hypothetical protein
MRVRAFLVCAFLTAACGKVDPAEDGGGGDHRDDDGGGTVIADAGEPDATPVACDGPEDCMNPDDPCLLPGTCEDNVCHFEAMDCSELDSDCTAGVCEGGECVERNVREDDPCGGGLMDCGSFGSCGGFAEPCGESGTQSRSCTDSTCQAGECVTGTPYSDSRNCMRNTDGVTCAASTTSCGTCAYSSTCDRTAPDVSCTRTDHTCASESCGTTMVSLPSQPCDRDTECFSCLTVPGGQPGSCSVNGTCGAQCQ